MTARSTIVITQRERFGMTKESLDSLYQHTPEAIDVVYVDAGSPPHVAELLRQEAEERGFTLVRREQFLTPNEARNIGIELATTEFVVFCDNDLIFSDGWLKAMEDCADETGAAIVVPLTCQGLPAHSEVHQAGGAFSRAETVEAFFADTGKRPFTEIMNAHGEKMDDVGASLTREDTGMCEFHCVMARRDFFDAHGLLDENMLSTKEHIDFSMTAHAAGERVVFEPSSVVTYVFPCRERPLEKSDWPFFSFRWSDAYGTRSLNHFIEKWNLDAPEDFIHGNKVMYWKRRMQAILIPSMAKVPVLNSNWDAVKMVAKLSTPIERVVNRSYVARVDRERRQMKARAEG